MRKSFPSVIVAALAIAGGVLVSGSAWSQKAPKTCTEAYRACSGQSAIVPKECDEQKKWCLTTGSFEDPKTKAVHMGLVKK